MTQLQPVAQTQRCGTFIFAGGSSSVAANGNVATSLIGSSETWADVLTKSVVTTPIADAVTAGTQMPFFIRCPRGTWVDSSGNRWFNHCNPNGVVVRVPGPYHALNVAAASGAGGTRLSTGYGTFLAGLNAQGCPITSYNNGLPNHTHPTGSILSNWASDPLTQGNGYPTQTNVRDLDYTEALLQDELTNGCTEFAFDGTGQDQSAYMLSNTLFPILSTAGAYQLPIGSPFTNSIGNTYARKVCVEANPLVGNTWLEPYSFCAANPTFENRIGDSGYLQPTDMTSTPAVIIQGPDESDYNDALRLLGLGYRAWVKWTAMRTTMGQAAMLALLEAGMDDVDIPEEATTTSTSDAWLKMNAGRRGWILRSAGWRQRFRGK